MRVAHHEVEGVRGLSGRVVLVTGATGLLGGAIARRFVAEDAYVAVAARDVSHAADCIANEFEAGDPRLMAVALDLAQSASIDRAVEMVSNRWGRVNVLVANASLRDGLEVPFEAVTAAGFTRLFEVDVAGHFLCARRLVESRDPGQPLTIVFMSSIYAAVGVDPMSYPPEMPPAPVQYASAKAGVLGLSRYLAARWGSQGVRVNAVIAGGVETAQGPPPEFVRRYAATTMLGRMAKADEIATVVAFLASDDASYVSGESLSVDGGLTAW